MSKLEIPSELQNSILASILEEVCVWVIDGKQGNNLISFLKKSGFKNILTKKENGLTTVAAQRETVTPTATVEDGNISPDVLGGCAVKFMTSNCDYVSAKCSNYYQINSLGSSVVCIADGEQCRTGKKCNSV